MEKLAVLVFWTYAALAVLLVVAIIGGTLAVEHLRFVWR